MSTERETINALVAAVNRQALVIEGLSVTLWDMARKHPRKYRELFDLLAALPPKLPVIARVDEPPEWNPEADYVPETVDIWPGRR